MPLTIRKYLSSMIAFAGVLALVLVLAQGASAGTHHSRATTRRATVVDRSGARDNSPDRTTGPRDTSVDRSTGAKDNSPDRSGATDNSPDGAGSQDKSSDSSSGADDNSPDRSGSPNGSDNTPDTAAQRG
jgi:hypothetical protein